MKTYEKTGRAKKAGPTLTPDGKTLLRGTCSCAKSCGNQDDGRAFCRCSHHADEYREIAELNGELRTEFLRRDMESLLIGPDRAELTNYAHSVTRNRAEAEEIVQAACFKAFQCSATYDRRRSLSGWLKVILRNAFYDGMRHSRLNLSLDFEPDADGFTVGDELAAPEIPVEDRMEREGQTAVLLLAISQLPTPTRRVVTLCDLEGLNYEAAAVRLRLPLGTVRSRLSRGHRVLREKVHRLTNSVNGRNV